MKKIVFFTGAGMSRESGLPTFRGEGGVWNTIDVEKVADARSWYCGRSKECREKRQAVLDFFNPLRRAIMACGPNDGHRLIAACEAQFDVTVITQNGDDYHERAGSASVIHLHGEAMKNASTANPYLSFPVDRDNPDIKIGDKAPDGSQLRPYVIFFNENIDRRLWSDAVKATRGADVFVVVGSSMLVHPAVDLLWKIKPECRLYVIDPESPALPARFVHDCTYVPLPASAGIVRVLELESATDSNE